MGDYSISEETRRRLLWHAGFAEIENEESPSIAASTWPADADPSVLEEAVADFLRVLESLNRELNGEDAAKRTTVESESIPRDAAYAVIEAYRMIREFEEKRGSEKPLPRNLWRLEFAWAAVLAGDISDIHEHLEVEERMRR